MNKPYSNLIFKCHESLKFIDPTDWDQCAGNNPFTRHAFLEALETSSSVGPETGWQPQHLTVHNQDGALLACAPLYLKSHSYGEYVFDQGWAEAFDRAGGNYYPKLQCAAPFSPVPGHRLLCRSEDLKLTKALALYLPQLRDKLGLSSVHLTFGTREEYETLGKMGWLQRLGIQYHWHNQNYTSFDDFLGKLTSRHRKNIKNERKKVADHSITFHALRGHEISETDWDHFYSFYQGTVDRKWGTAYLKRRFFSLLADKVGDSILLFIAKHNGEPIAGALNLVGSDTLYGRNWGCQGHWPFLHFELCYYQAIEFAIAHGLKHVEAGAQGEHKILRGYIPEMTHSLHHIANPDFSNAVDKFLQSERYAINLEFQELMKLSPYRQGD